MGLLARALSASLVLSVATSATALETDQYYAWRRPLADSGDALNAKLNFEITAALAEINAVDNGRGESCRAVVDAIHDRYALFIFQKIELWAQRTAVLSRIPATTDEELVYREKWIYGGLPWYDLGLTVPPSPTIEVAGVRFGTDKISHFFSEGHYYLEWYEGARERGLSHDDALKFAIERGITIETTVLGGVISGVISPGDLEANYVGVHWYIDLCEGDAPLLQRTEAGWALPVPFDLRPFVSPEWDESYSPNVVLDGRWVNVRPAIQRHCGDLADPAVQARRAAYAARDSETYTEKLLAEMVRTGRLKNPRDYGIDHLCDVALPAPATASNEAATSDAAR